MIFAVIVALFTVTALYLTPAQKPMSPQRMVVENWGIGFGVFLVLLLIQV